MGKELQVYKIDEFWRWTAMMVTHCKYLIALSCTLEMGKLVEFYVMYILPQSKYIKCYRSQGRNQMNICLEFDSKHKGIK